MTKLLVIFNCPMGIDTNNPRWFNFNTEDEALDVVRNYNAGNTIRLDLNENTTLYIGSNQISSIALFRDK